jgi:hypothetical protein
LTIRRDADLRRTEAESRSAAIGTSGSKKAETDFRRPASDTRGDTADPVEELRRMMNEDVVARKRFFPPLDPAPSTAFLKEIAARVRGLDTPARRPSNLQSSIVLTFRFLS